ncbi:hypothetical protein [Ornithobacterium rhinotracheale]
MDDPWSNVKGFVNFFSQKSKGGGLPFIGKSSKSQNRNELIDEGAKTILTFVASSVVSRFKLGFIPKIIITSGVAFATPYVVDFVQKKIRNRKTKKK